MARGPIITTYARPSHNADYARRVLAIMAEVVYDYLKDSDLVTIAKKLKGRDIAETLRNDFRFLQQRIRYVPDPPGLEDIRSPRRTIIDGEGEDCDGMAVAAATILLIQGFNVELQAIAWRNEDFTHVLARVILPGGAVPFDLTLPELGKTHRATKEINIKMIRRLDDRAQTFADLSPQTTIELGKVLYSGDARAAREAYMILRESYPRDMQRWFEMAIRQTRPRMFRPNEIGDVGGIFDVVSEVIGVVTGVVTGNIPSVVANGGAIIAEASGGGKVEITEADQINMTSKYPPFGAGGRGDETKGIYGVLITPGGLKNLEVFGSFSGQGVVDAGWNNIMNQDGKGFVAAQKGTAMALQVGTKGQGWHNLPGLYVANWFNDGTHRFDLVPGSAGVINVSNVKAQQSGAGQRGGAGQPYSNERQERLPEGAYVTPGGQVINPQDWGPNQGQGVDRGQGSNAMPSWLLPAGIGLAAILLMKK